MLLAGAGRLVLLRERNFRLLLTSQAISNLGDRAVEVALAFAVLGLGGGAAEIGLVLAARLVPLVGCVLFGGVLADRLPRRSLMVACDLLRTASQAATAGLLLVGAAQVWSLAALAAVTGAATGVFSPASTGLLPSVVAADQLQRANGLRASVLAGGDIAGPALGGLLVAGVGAGWALAADAASFALSAGLLVRLDLGREPAPARRSSFAADLRAGWEAFSGRTWVWSFVAYASLGNLLGRSWLVLGPVVAARELGGAKAWGAVLAAHGAGGLLGALIAIRAQPARPMLVATVTGALLAAPLALLAAGAALPLLSGAAAVGGICLMLSNTLWESSLQWHVPQHTLSRVSAYDWFGSMALAPVGLVIWGPLAKLIGVSAALWLAFALTIGSGLLMLTVREIWTLGAAPAATEGGVPPRVSDRR